MPYKHTLPAPCPVCGVPFPRKRPTHQFCSYRCANQGKRQREGQPLISRLVADNGYLVWTGHRDSLGYGKLIHGRKAYLAHRFAWEQSHGPIPTGMKVLHHCDNPPCCNVDHLFLGTDADNSADMIAKGREARGERIGRAELTENSVRAIRIVYGRGGVSMHEVARRFGVSYGTVHSVLSRRTWWHVLDA